MLEHGIHNQAKWATLEVKESNIPARSVYEKFGFTYHGRRKNYYQHDKEDALIMWTEDLNTLDFKESFEYIKKDLRYENTSGL